VSEAFTAWLTNAADYTAPAGAAAVTLRYTNVRQNSAAAVFSPQADGSIVILKAGVVDLSVSFDVITAAGFNYAQMDCLVNGTVITNTLAHSAGGGFWGQVHGNLHWKVNANDSITCRAYPSQIGSVDNGVWSVLSMSWTGLP
jgi:hypothetical protein